MLNSAKQESKHAILTTLLFPRTPISTCFSQAPMWRLKYFWCITNLSPFFPLREIDQTRKQVMTMSVWSCSAWRQWQTCNPCRTSIAPPWRGARRLWRRRTSTSKWKTYYGHFVNFLTPGAFVLYAFMLSLQGFFCWYLVPPLTYSQQRTDFIFARVIRMNWVKPRKKNNLVSCLWLFKKKKKRQFCWLVSGVNPDLNKGFERRLNYSSISDALPEEFMPEPALQSLSAPCVCGTTSVPWRG